MSRNLTRRSLLAGAGYAATYGTLAARLLSLAEAQQAQPKAAAPALTMNMYFPNGPKAKIDDKLYITKHMQMLRTAYGDSVERIEYRTSQSPSSGMPPASLLASSHILIKDLQRFIKVLTEKSSAINIDLDSAAKGPRLVQIDRLGVGMGEEISAVIVGSQVLTVHYPAGPTEKWDEKYFIATHLPKIYTAFGQSALRRMEGRLGVDQGDAKAKYKGTIQLHVREHTAFDGALQQGRDELLGDTKNFTTIIPEFNELRVQAIV